MYSIVYASSATRKFSDNDLVELLKESRENNNQSDITGLLLYKDGNFMQVLEGEKNTIEKLFEVIRKDNRHTGEIILLEKKIEERQFHDWSMGFRNLNNSDHTNLTGYNEFLNHSLIGEEFQSSPTKCQKLLNLFKKNIR